MTWPPCSRRGPCPPARRGSPCSTRPGPGRAGAVIERLLGPPRESGPDGGGRLQRVAYVSCDPATLARDIAVFGELGWQLAGLRAFDAFPMTHHVECVAALTPA